MLEEKSPHNKLPPSPLPTPTTPPSTPTTSTTSSTTHLSELLEAAADSGGLVLLGDFDSVFQRAQEVDVEVVDLVDVGEDLVDCVLVAVTNTRDLQQLATKHLQSKMLH